MGTLDGLKQQAKTMGWWAFDDALPMDTPLVLMVGTSSAGVSGSWLVNRLALAGVTATFLGVGARWDRIYFFTGVVAGLDLFDEEGKVKRVTTTPATIEQIAGVPVALVKPNRAPGALTPALVEALKDLQDSRRESASGDYTTNRIFGQDEYVPVGLWVVARCYGASLPTTIELRSQFIKLGFRAVALDAGISGWIAGGGWTGEGFAEVCVRSDDANNLLVARDVASALGYSTTFYTSNEVSVRQFDLTTSEKVQNLEEGAGDLVGGGAKFLADVMESLGSFLSGGGKVLFYGALALAGLWGVGKVYRAWRGPAGRKRRG